MESGEQKKTGLFKKHRFGGGHQAVGPSTSQPRRRTSTVHTRVDVDQEPAVPFSTRCCTFIYNTNENTFCGRTCQSWLYIIVYSIVYGCFLTAYMLLVLFAALWIIRFTTDFSEFRASEIDFLKYSDNKVGLSMTPITESYQPLIWYRQSNSQDYEKYVNALDQLLIKKRKKRSINLGPCGERPYGYAVNMPCVIVRINKHFHWSGKPLQINSSEARDAPVEVKNWMKKDKKLWLHCEGFHSYDKEHIGRIRYFPDPPGFDPAVFPLGSKSDSPLVAIQISDFTLGLSLSVECKLWYANGPASIDFMLYVVSNDKAISNRTNV